MAENIIRLADRVKEISYTMGTGNMALSGAVTGFTSFASKFSDNDSLFYAITNGSTYEVGSGIFLSSPYSQIIRFPIVSSNSNNRVDFAEGIKEVYVTYPATHAVYNGSGIGNLNIPQTNSLAIWASPNTLDSDSGLIWNKEFSRLGVNNGSPDYGIHLGGAGAKSMVKASGFLVGSSGVYFQPSQSYAGGLQTKHYEPNQLDQYALSQSLIGQLTGTSAVFDLSGVVNQYILFKKQNAGLVLAGPASGCTPPCSPAYPSFRQLTYEDIPAIGEVSGILNNKIFIFASGANAQTLSVSGILNNKINSVSGLISAGMFPDGDKGDILVSNSGSLWTIDDNAVTNSKIANNVITSNKLSYNNAHLCCGRLTLESGVPVSTANQADKSVLYYTPYNGSVISLYNTTSSQWDTINFSQASLPIAGLGANNNYDVFGYNNSGVLTLELSLWINDTTRNVGLTTYDGVYCKAGNISRRYLGTIRTVNSNTIDDTVYKRFVWNANNRVTKKVYNITAPGPWTYSSATWRPLNNIQTTAEVVGGLPSFINLTAGILFTAPLSGATLYYFFGISKDTAVTSPLVGTRSLSYNNPQHIQLLVDLLDTTSVGYQYFYPVESTQATSTPATLYGSNWNSYFGGIYGTWEC